MKRLRHVVSSAALPVLALAACAGLAGLGAHAARDWHHHGELGAGAFHLHLHLGQHRHDHTHEHPGYVAAHGRPTSNRSEPEDPDDRPRRDLVFTLHQGLQHLPGIGPTPRTGNERPVSACVQSDRPPAPPALSRRWQARAPPV